MGENQLKELSAFSTSKQQILRHKTATRHIKTIRPLLNVYMFIFTRVHAMNPAQQTNDWWELYNNHFKNS